MNICIAYRVCLCYCILGFVAHSIILGTYSDANDCDENDNYDSLGYGSHFEEFLDECYE